MSVDIKIYGTEKDAKLLKKILRQYAQQTASVNEKDACACYIRLIELAEVRAYDD